MSDHQIGTYKFVASPFHVDFMGRLSIGVLGKHMLNSADAFALERGFDLAEREGEHYTWVLSRLATLYAFPHSPLSRMVSMALTASAT